MSFSFLLLLAQIVARALALVGGRAFARVARKGTLENEHLRAFLRRLHAKGVIGAEGQSLLHVMNTLVHVVSAVARFDGACPVDRHDRPPVWRIANDAPAPFHAAPVFPNDSS